MSGSPPAIYGGQEPLTAPAPGKVNLCLWLGRARSDGKHALVSVVQPVSLADELTLTIEPDLLTDEVVCPAVPGENLALRAIRAFRAETGWDGPPIRLSIDKHVPVAAGMGGGSADAAAALRLISLRSGFPIPSQLPAQLGADVPAQLHPSRTLVTGAGEHVEPIDTDQQLHLVILPSKHALSTADVFAEADRLNLPRPDDELLEIAERTREHAHDLPPELRVNDLQPAAISLCPDIEHALTNLEHAGAHTAMVSGSGPTTYGLFTSQTAAEQAAAELARAHPSARACTRFHS